MKEVNLKISILSSFWNGNFTDSILKFKEFCKQQEKGVLANGVLLRKRVLVCCKSIGILESLKKIFIENDIDFIYLKNFNEITEVSSKKICVCRYIIEEGIEMDNVILIPDTSIIGKHLSQAKNGQQNNLKKLKISLNQFLVNDLVVHKEYGIGLFEGIFTLTHASVKYDTVKILYQNGDILYLPVYNLNQLTKYGANVEEEEKHSLLDKLGGNGFAIRKARAKKRIFEIADKLMKIAARRDITQAGIFTIEAILTAYQEFIKSFPYELTQDQALAIEDTVSDLASGKIMERLICGDVGFGKTEIAIRASFIVTFGRNLPKTNFGQVAIIVPTTLLAKQHYNNFLERFKGTGIVVEELSRNVSAAKREYILKNIASGKIDILIGTHALLSKNIKFADLQMVIIDEEQHFGVKQKEKLKEAKDNIHFLSLSATPIPRTLQMSLSGLRDISILTTPPIDRLLPKTFLMPYDIIVLSAAIRREKERCGRVFFVAPRISDLEEQKEKLAAALPDIQFAVAHGKIAPDKLEDIMLKFYEGVYDVLVTTSIVESGIDISFANTIIIYKAEMFGLSQAYQLRGRVGRGNVQSYAYFIIDEKNFLTDSPAKKRLLTLVNIESLGGGFQVAGADMDIRGAGNLIGEDQSGKINEVGVELYQDLLKEAVEKLKGKEAKDNFIPEIKIGVEARIPETYIKEFSLRLEFYRRISAVGSYNEMNSLIEEMEDRFGPISAEVANLLKIVHIKIRCRELGILKLETGIKGILVRVSEHHFEHGDAILNLALKKPSFIKIGPDGKINFFDSSSDLFSKTEKILDLISG